MAITINDLILFNNVESTDLIHGVTQIPYYKPLTFVRGKTYVSGYEELILGNEGRGTQVLIRKLGKGGATAVKADTAGAFKYNHKETKDDIVTVRIDDVIKESEELYQAVELARVSADAGRKAEIVMNNIIEISQKTISDSLVDTLPVLADTTPVDKTNIKKFIIDSLSIEMSYRPTVILVSREVYAVLLDMQTTGEFVANYDSIYTGFVGHILGVEVYLNEDFDADVEFALYNHNFWNVFEMLQFFDIVPATDFNGSYIRGLFLQGTYGESGLTAETGNWGVVKKKA